MANPMTSDFSRRDFLKVCAAGTCALCLPAIALGEEGEPAPSGESQLGGVFYVKEARYYEKIEHKRIRCLLCPNRCEVGDQERGYCGVRENRDGIYYTLAWGNPCSGLDGGIPDPVEKKPLFHVLPGTGAYSIATAGCNVECKFCQNWDISQTRPEQTRNFDLPPEAVVKNAARYRCRSVAFTYSEPVVFYEYVLDTAVAARRAGLHALMISNGFIEPDPMRELLPHLSAVKIDLKGFTEKFYHELVSGKLEPVLNTLKLLKEQGKWFEIVYLVVPTHNDDVDEIRSMAKWIHQQLGPDVPVHYTCFHPTYKLSNLPRTPVSSVENARRVSMEEGLRYVYVGNVPHGPDGHPGESTYCHNCHQRIVHRIGFEVRDLQIKDGQCTHCHAAIPGLWSA